MRRRNDFGSLESSRPGRGPEHRARGDVAGVGTGSMTEVAVSRTAVPARRRSRQPCRRAGAVALSESPSPGAARGATSASPCARVPHYPWFGRLPGGGLPARGLRLLASARRGKPGPCRPNGRPLAAWSHRRSSPRTCLSAQGRGSAGLRGPLRGAGDPVSPGPGGVRSPRSTSRAAPAAGRAWARSGARRDDAGCGPRRPSVNAEHNICGVLVHTRRATSRTSVAARRPPASRCTRRPRKDGWWSRWRTPLSVWP